MALHISILLLFVGVFFCGQFALADLSRPLLGWAVDIVGSTAKDVHRPKRSLTTICVEIKPSGPQEEPYFMCKGTDLPTFHKGSNDNTDFGSPQNSGSNEPSSVNGGGSKFQPTPTKSFSSKSQPSLLHPSHFSSSNSNAEQISPHGKSGGGFQQALVHTPNAFSGLKKSQPQQHQKQQQPQYFQNTENHFQSEDDPAPNFGKQLNDHESSFADDAPSQPTFSQPATGFGFSSNDAAHTHYDQPSSYEPQYGYGPGYEASSIQPPDEAAFSRFQPKSNIRGKSYAQPSFTATYSKADNKKSSPAKTVPHANAAHAAALAQQSEDSFEATPSTIPFVAAAIAKPKSSFLEPAVYRNDGPNYGSNQRQPSYKPKVKQSYSLPLQQQHPYHSTLQTGFASHRMMFDDDDLLDAPNWGFRPNGFNIFRNMADDEQNIDLPQSPMHTQQFEPQRNIPLEHLDDPFMQQFYASLHDTPSPSSQFRASKPPESTVLGVSYTERPIQKSVPPYKKPTPKTETCPTHTPAAAPIYIPATSVPCDPMVSYPQLAMPKQYMGASDYLPHAENNCHACQMREYSFQPMLIAVPCYGQQAYGDGHRKLPSTPAEYDIVGMPGPSANLFGTPSFVNPMSNLFLGPHTFFPNLGISDFTSRLLGSSQRLPDADIVSPNPYIYYKTTPMSHFQAVQSSTLPESRKTTDSDEVESMSTTDMTTSKNLDDLFDSEEEKQIESQKSEGTHIEQESDSSSHEDSLDPQPLSEENQTTYSSTPRFETPVKLKPKVGKKFDEITLTTESGATVSKLETATQKTFKAMLDAAKAFSQISNQEFPIEGVPKNVGTSDRLEKRHQLRSAVANNPNYKRKYLQKM